MTLAIAAPLEAPDVRSAYQSELDSVWRLLVRLGVAPADIEDTVHEVFLIAIRRWPSYDAARPLRPWLFGIAYRVVSETRRRRPPRIDAVEETGTTPESELAAAQARALLMRALASLEIERRAVFVMHDVDGLTALEVAEALEIPVNTVYSRLRRAREDLARTLRCLQGGES